MNSKELQKIIWDCGGFETGDTVVCGFSGGADSLCLLDGLTGLAKRKKLRVVACHVHHAIRGDEADADAA
ncbi:MAG: tRNA(Ile)-lysidine synthetase, partial [Firmicutes bacterium]|nr:tRNA(Ile)-lysidine synthetase [Bacillota bacterium]